MNSSQLTQIRTYLLDKKLPIDILVEVYDHFVTQMSGSQKEEGLTFEEAFDKVKVSWRNELQPYWDGGWDLFDKNNMTRKIERTLIWTALRKSIKYSIAITLIMAALSQVFSIVYFSWIFFVGVSAIVLLPVINLLWRWRTFMLPKKYDNYVLTLYQSFNFLNLLFAYWFYRLISGAGAGARTFSTFFEEFGLNSGLAAVLIYFSCFTVSFFTIFSQVNYLKRIEKIKPFLKHLNV